MPNIVDLDALVFEEGSRLFTADKFSLPKGTTRSVTKSYEQFDVPAPEKHRDTQDKLIYISQLPEWAQQAFPPDYKTLNTIQSKVFPTAFESDNNMLMCAPTGAGKTNVALLAMLRTIAQHRDAGRVDLDGFKIVYIAPLKALVQEQVAQFSKRLEPFGIKVAELTGDRNLTKQQISETQVIVTTPEKWDVITRKSSDTSYTNLVRLMVIDEIHLLHDERGPVLESIVARTVRRTETSDLPVRIVGLSATLPNYKDVARFIRAENGVHFFDSTFRPVPLSQKFIGITERKAIKRYQAMNDACYDKVLEYAGKHQMLIFVHSRKETAKTARFLRDRAQEEGTLAKFLANDNYSKELLRSESEEANSPDLKDLLPTGFAIHHAGLNRADRTSVEDLFRERRIQVLVCTATLAWGVNLPAHTVIIKGTQVYNPAKGRWSELSAQDVLQMLGRAGRPGYDRTGEGIIITAHSELNYYMSLINAKLPIESQFMAKLADSLNAEVSLGTIQTREQAVEWLGYTYLFVRMLRSPAIYRVGQNYEGDRTLVRRRNDLAHSAFALLAQNKLILYNEASGQVRPTELGRIASHFYISHSSMGTYNQQLKPYLTPIEVLRVFSQSEEFKYIPVRQEEKIEISKLLDMAPVPIKESVDEPAAKINVLLQAYICKLKLDGFALAADMVYVTQSAGRLLRAMYEICLVKRWAALTRLSLDLCKMVERRMWLSNSPLRQFPRVSAEVIRKTEASQMPWSRYFDLADPAEVGQAIRMESKGREVYRMIQQFPRFDMSAHFQPISRTLLRVELVIQPRFEWNAEVHGASETFLLVVEDGDGERILYNDTFVLRQKYADSEHIVDFAVPLTDPLPPNYFVSLVSEKWLHCETKIPLTFNKLHQPAKFPAHTPLLDIEPVPVSDLKNPAYEAAFPFSKFNAIQSQAFHALYRTEDNVFIGAATGNGKTVCAELAFLKYWDAGGQGKVIYLNPFQQQIDALVTDWTKRFAEVNGGVSFGKASGDLQADLVVLAENDVLLATPEQWDVVSRKWRKKKQGKFVQRVELVIADELQMIGGFNGAVYELVLARQRLMAAQLEATVRTVGLSVPLANGRDVAEWLGAKGQAVFNFAPSERVNFPLKVRLSSFTIPHHPSLMIAMARPTYAAVSQSDEQKSVVFVNDRRQCIETSIDIARHATTDDNTFLAIEQDRLQKYLPRVQDPNLSECLPLGIGLYYPSMAPGDKKLVETLYEAGAIRVLIASIETCWYCPAGDLVVVMGTQFYEGREHRYLDYPISDILQATGKSRANVLVLTNATKRDYYHKFLSEALPIQSHLHEYLADALVAEITEKTIQSPEDSMDWLTYTLFYRLLNLNPSFYGLEDVSPDGLSEYLSDLIDSTLKELADAKVIDRDEEDDSIEPLNNAFIATHYAVSFITMQIFVASLSAKTRSRGILDVVTAAAEYETLPVRTHEDKELASIYRRQKYTVAEPNYESPAFKAFTLLQAHMSRTPLSPDLVADRELVLKPVVRLLSAAVDVLSSEGYLNALNAIDLCQRIVQGIQDKDSPLLQIPYFSADIVARCNASNISTVYDFMEIVEDDDLRNRLLGFDDEDSRMAAVADFVNKYPNIDITADVVTDEVRASEPARLRVHLTRHDLEDDEEADVAVSAHRFPFPKRENWWIVVGNDDKRQLYGIKSVSILRASQDVNVDFIAPVSGPLDLKVWCLCDSYVGVDKEIPDPIRVDVLPGDDDNADVEMND